MKVTPFFDTEYLTNSYRYGHNVEEKIHLVGTISNVETSYFTQLKMCYLMTTFSRARESSVTHKSAITDYAVEENHVIDWDKAKVIDREAQRQTRWIKEALWIRKTPTCMNRMLPTQPHMGPGDIQVTCYSKL